MSIAPAEQFIMVKGYIDAKDERQRTIYGTFMAIVSRRDMRYLGVAFGLDEISKDTGFDELHTLLEQHGKSERDAAFVRDEAELYKFFDVSRTLQGIAKNRNPKQAEQTISRFCAENLHLKAVTFVGYTEATETYLSRFLPPEEKNVEEFSQPEPLVESQNEAKPEKKEAARSEERKDSRDFIVRCEPVLDPVRGVAMSELAVGSYVCAKLPEDSVFFKLFTKNFRGFDGIINAQVSGILVNELGTATVSLALADGVAGVMKMSGKVRVRTAANPNGGGSKRRVNFNLQTLPVEVAFGVAGIFILLSVIGLILYLTA